MTSSEIVAGIQSIDDTKEKKQKAYRNMKFPKLIEC